MKRKILYALFIIGLILLAGILYIIVTINQAAINLDKLTSIQGAEILRKELLLEVEKVQNDLFLHETELNPHVMTIVNNVKNMETILSKCYSCHDSGNISARLKTIKQQLITYKSALSRAITLRTKDRVHKEIDQHALVIGQNLFNQIQNIAVHQQEILHQTAFVLETTNRSKKYLILLVCAGFGLFLICAFLLIHAFSEPLQHLLNATKKLQKGDLDYRIVNLKDEFGEVAQSFNQMAASLKEQLEGQIRTNQLLASSEIATSLAHEIKNPLAGIKVAMQVLSLESSISPEDQIILTKVVKEVDRVESLLNSLLTYARPPKPQFVEVNLNEILDNSLNFIPDLAGNEAGGHGKIMVEKNFSQPVSTILADSSQLQQVFLNLLLNAVAAMPDGGIISLAITSCKGDEAGKFIISIGDTGPGFAEDILPLIFKPFFTTKARGTGLGLATCLSLIKQHNGTISAKNRKQGGAIFRIVLPVTHKVSEDA